jgi:hypothetical protein
MRINIRAFVLTAALVWGFGLLSPTCWVIAIE